MPASFAPAFPLLVALGLGCPSLASAQVPIRNLDLRSHVDEYPPASPGGTDYSACWSYVHADGREYAVIGVGDGNGGNASEGTAIYNVTDPAAPRRVAFIPGPASIWREMKQYRSWIYVVTEGYGTGEGVQIIRMTDPEHPVLAATYTGSFHRSHTVSVDTSRAILVCNGTRVNGGGGLYPFAGVRVLSLASPEAPLEIAHWPVFTPSTYAQEDTFYVHDSVPVGNRLYASSVTYGIQRILDFTDPANPVQISAWRYPGGFTHNAWPDASGQWLYVTDEKDGEPLKIFDLSNLAAPSLFNTFTPNPGAIVHNVHVKDGEIYLANYTEGIRVLDASDPAHPAEFAYADTWGGISGDYNGVWEVCPFFPSGTVIASDRTSGLWVFRVQRNYGLLRAKVVDAATLQPLAGAQVFLDSGDSLATTPGGVVVFAPNPGSHSVTAHLFGYAGAAAVRTVAQGSRDTLVLALTPRPTASFSGTIRSAATEAALEDAELDLDYTPLHAHSNAAGQFALGGIPSDLYRVVVRCPGTIPVAFTRQVGPGAVTMDFHLVPAPFYDPLESGAGWSTAVASDDPGGGQWILADPLGTSVGGGGPIPSAARAAPAGDSERGLLSLRSGGASPAHEGHSEAFGLVPGPVQPEDDRSPAGTKCFVTGQGTNPARVDEADVDGTTTLTSPALDLTGKTIPAIGYWRWFFTNTGGRTDYLAVLISGNNGSTWVPVDTTWSLDNHWEERTIRVADYIAPTSQVRVRFVVVDGGGTSVVEAAVDDIIAYDAATLPVGAWPDAGAAPARLRLRAPWPNPAAGSVRAVLELPATGRVEAEVLDLQGRRVATVADGLAAGGARVLEWDGRSDRGRPADAGVYFLVARAGGATATARFVKLR